MSLTQAISADTSGPNRSTEGRTRTVCYAIRSAFRAERSRKLCPPYTLLHVRAAAACLGPRASCDGEFLIASSTCDAW
jgi:hypothetical protein